MVESSGGRTLSTSMPLKGEPSVAKFDVPICWGIGLRVVVL